MSAIVNRPVRTAAQSTVAFAVVEFTDSFNIISMDERQYGAAVVILTIVFSWVQVLVENKLNIGFLRTSDE